MPHESCCAIGRIRSVLSKALHWCFDQATFFLKTLHYEEYFGLYAALSLAAGVCLTYVGLRKGSRS